MSVRQLGSRCASAARQLAASQTAAAQEAVQQQCGRQNAVFQQLRTNMRYQAQRHYSQAFQPSRLYPKQHTTAETYAFWGLIGVNVAITFAAKAALPEIRQSMLQHCRASIEAVSNGRIYTLLTSSVCHTSAIHCAFNLLMLGLFRRTQPLTAKEVGILLQQQVCTCEVVNLAVVHNAMNLAVAAVPSYSCDDLCKRAACIAFMIMKVHQ